MCEAFRPNRVSVCERAFECNYCLPFYVFSLQSAFELSKFADVFFNSSKHIRFVSFVNLLIVLFDVLSPRVSSIFHAMHCRTKNKQQNAHMAKDRRARGRVKPTTNIICALAPSNGCSTISNAKHWSEKYEYV